MGFFIEGLVVPRSLREFDRLQGTRLGVANVERLPFKFFPIQSRNGCFSFELDGHLDKTKSSGHPARPILNNVYE